MRKLFTILAAVLITANMFAQAPQKMSYQAVIRDASNKLVISHAVGMKITILQNTTSVYTETQTPTTNANGLLTIEIGSGAGFNTIDWANGTYFIKTETDPTGGTTYSITGTSQLLSVPYALHASNGITTAEKTKLTAITGTNTGDQDISGLATTTAVTTGLALKVDKVTGKDLSTNDYTTAEKTKLTAITGTNTGDQDLSGLATTTAVTTGLALKVDKVTGKDLSTNDYTTAEKTKLSGLTNADGSETKVTAGTNVTVTGAGTTASPYVVNASGGESTHYVGELYGGGIVFYVDNTGQHGLVCSVINISTNMFFSNINTVLIGATAQSYWDGQSNSDAIIAQIGHTTSGAGICIDYVNSDYGTGVYSDWYLPAIDEIVKLYGVRYELNKILESDGNSSTFPFGFDTFISSTEFTSNQSMNINFVYGNSSNNAKSYIGTVRAVRAF